MLSDLDALAWCWAEIVLLAAVLPVVLIAGFELLSWWAGIVDGALSRNGAVTTTVEWLFLTRDWHWVWTC